MKTLKRLTLLSLLLPASLLQSAVPPQEVKVVETQQSVKGRPIPIFRFGTGESEYIFLFGGFHGNEPQGPYILEQIMKLLAENPAYYADKSVFVVPRVNPDGLAAKTRGNAHKVDLNRNFPTANYRAEANRGTAYYGGPKALSEPESQIVYQLLAPFVTPENSDKIKILSIHAPYAVNNYDGPAKELAERMKQFNAYTVSSDIGYPTPGSFGTYYGKEKGLRVVTLETDNSSPQAAWSKQQKAILALLQYPSLELYPKLTPPSISPTPLPTATPEIEVSPTPEPTLEPTPSPTALPSTAPSRQPWWPLPQRQSAEAQRAVPQPDSPPDVVPDLSPPPSPMLAPASKPSSPAVKQPVAYQPGQQKLPVLSKNALLKVSKKQQTLTVIDQGKTLAVFPVSTGIGSKDTPLGSFKVLNRIPNPSYTGSPHLGRRSYPPLHPNNPLGTRWMQISAWHYRTGVALGIHGTDEPQNVGKAVSGGCVRMHNRDVELLFQVLQVGTRVVIGA